MRGRVPLRPGPGGIAHPSDTCALIDFYTAGRQRGYTIETQDYFRMRPRGRYPVGWNRGHSGP